MCLPIQMQDSSKDNVTSDNMYPPPLPAPHTHEKQQPQFMLACRCDYDENKIVMMVETEWVISKEAVGNS